MIDICKDCGKEKEIHRLRLCNACSQKFYRGTRRVPVNPNKLEREKRDKLRKFGCTMLDICSKGFDIISADILDTLSAIGNDLLTGAVTLSSIGEHGADGCANIFLIIHNKNVSGPSNLLGSFDITETTLDKRSCRGNAVGSRPYRNQPQLEPQASFPPK